jgi:hypothetical protein
MDDNSDIDELVQETIEDGNLDGARSLLLTQGASATCALWAACAYNQLDFAKWLISFTKFSCDDFHTALVAACCSQNLSIVKLILFHIDASTTIENPPEFFREPFEEACGCSSIEIVKLIASHGVNNYNNPVWHAVKYSRYEVLNFLISKGVKLEGKLNEYRIIIELLNHGLDINLKHVKSHKYIKEKIYTRYCTRMNVRSLLKTFVPQDIVEYVLSNYIRYE